MRGHRVSTTLLTADALAPSTRAKTHRSIDQSIDQSIAFRWTAHEHRAPAPPIAHIHNRMPVILESAAEASWIDTAATFADVSELLIPYKAGPLKAEEETPPPPRQPDLFG